MTVITEPRRTNERPSFVFEVDPVPLYMDSEGEVRVVGTRIPMETVLWYYEQGDKPEAIVDQFPSLKLADVYAIIGYYLRHREDVDRYLQERRTLEEQARQEIEARWPPEGVRDRLLARLNTEAGQ
jgi:uncharacterized protein (DUF433 family)